MNFENLHHIQLQSANTLVIGIPKNSQYVQCRPPLWRSEDFEALAGDFFQGAAAPVTELLERNGLQPDSLAAVELLGGGSRVPAVKAALSAALGGRPLDMCAPLCPCLYFYFLMFVCVFHFSLFFFSSLK